MSITWRNWKSGKSRPVSEDLAPMRLLPEIQPLRHQQLCHLDRNILILSGNSAVADGRYAEIQIQSRGNIEVPSLKFQTVL